MKIISVRETPRWAAEATAYFQEQWASEETMMLYQDAIERSLTAHNPLPQWYLLVEDVRIVGCAGLITNDFISRIELYPWLCALYVEPDCRSRGLTRQLMRHIADEAKKHGFSHLHLCTDLVGFYEQVGFVYAGERYHPWGGIIARLLISVMMSVDRHNSISRSPAIEASPYGVYPYVVQNKRGASCRTR